MTDAPELKPCPWCGRSPKEIIDATRFLGVHRIVHRGCVLPNFIIEAATPEAAAAIWNTRADPTPTDAQVMALVEVDTLLLLDAYKGLLVLYRMLKKVGLSEGIKATESIIGRIVAAHPEFPVRAALRDLEPKRGEGE